jgi:hypothetical protein
MGTIVLLPGGFKPPHMGHVNLAKSYAENPEVEEVLILIGSKERDGITRDQSIKALKDLIKNTKIKIIPVSSDSPITGAFEYIMDLPKDTVKTYALGASDKGEDAKRLSAFANSIESYKTKATKDGKTVPPGIKIKNDLKVNIKPALYKGRTDEKNGQPISSTVARKDLLNGDRARFATNYPGVNREITDKLFDMFSKTIKEPEEKKPKKKKSKKKLKESHQLGFLLEQIAINRFVLIKLLTEGGAAGHMAHPFDIPTVKTGKDLINVFKETENFLQKNEVPVKIDGINSSIRLADIDGKKQFVIDRGSNKPLDVKGVTTKDLQDRFGEGHGMIKIGGKVLQIFNEALPSIQKPLAKLGMLKNPNIMLNLEYVEGKSNVQKYESNFLVIHNLLEIKQATPKRRDTEEIPYSKADLQALVDGLKPTAKKYGFEVFNVIPAKIEKKSTMDSELGKSYTVNITAKDKETKTLAEWLASAKNTKGEKIKLKDGKTVDALSKQVFVWIKDGKKVEDLVADPADYKKAIDSFVIYNATMQLGDALLKSMTSPLGEVDKQEGIVVRNPKVSSSPYKITGSFIIRGMQSAFGTAN